MGGTQIILGSGAGLTRTLDEELNSGFVDLIKIDCEGADGCVLRGAEESLKADKPIILMEWWPGQMDQYEVKASETASLLKELDYAPYAINEKPPAVRGQAHACEPRWALGPGT